MPVFPFPRFIQGFQTLIVFSISLVLLTACQSSNTFAPVVDATAIPVKTAGLTIMPAAATTAALPSASVQPVAANNAKIALLLPASGNLANVSNAVRAGFYDAYQQNPQANKPSISVYDTSGKSITAVYAKAVQDGATVVVGPLEKSDVQALANQGVDTFTLALNEIPVMSPPTNFYQFALAPQDEAQQLADKLWYQGYSQPLIIAPDTNWGQTALTAFTEQWQRNGGKNIAQSIYHIPGNPSSSIKANLAPSAANETGKTKSGHRSDVDVLVLIANPAQAYQIMPVLHANASDLPVYATSNLYSGIPNASKNQALNGVTFVEIPALVPGENPALTQVASDMQSWQQTHPNGLIRLYAFGYDAYQLTLNQPALAKVGFNYKGATGTLYTDNQQILHRRLAWASFANGLVVPAA